MTCQTTASSGESATVLRLLLAHPVSVACVYRLPRTAARVPSQNTLSSAASARAAPTCACMTAPAAGPAHSLGLPALQGQPTAHPTSLQGSPQHAFRCGARCGCWQPGPS